MSAPTPTPGRASPLASSTTPSAMPSAAPSPVLQERLGSTLVLTLNDPAARNAMSPAMREGLAAGIELARSDKSIRALVLAGHGGCFCAGGDIRIFLAAQGKATAADHRLRMQATHRWLADLLTLDKPVIAAVDGAAFGAGFSVALAADFILASPRARFCLSFMRIGLIPDCGSLFTLPRVVGMQRARELMLSAREVGADEALKLGIAMELHASEALLPRALALAASFEQASPLAVSLTKRFTQGADELTAILDAEANAQAMCLVSAEHQAAIARFMNKEPSAFQWPAAKPA